MRSSNGKRIAICGVFAALAITLMCIGGMIPFATYVCPLLCMVLNCFVLKLCGRRYAAVWYIAVSVLALLLGPDKEAAAVYIFLGNYPMIKRAMEKYRFAFVLKFIYFNAVVTALYGILIYLFGLDELLFEFAAIGVWGGVILLVLGNVTFVLTDKLLNKFLR